MNDGTLVRVDPNLAQRAAAAPDRSVWVTASAGSGKTKVLTDRVLRLLLDGVAPERILCLTFTKAAAAEMDVRLRRRLGEWATVPDADLQSALADLLGRPAGPETTTRARRLFAAVLDARGGPTIETVHAFCQSMLRRFPVEAGVAPHFDVSDERTAQDELRAARDSMLRNAKGATDSTLAAALATVTGHVGELSFDELMRSLIGERGRLLRLAAGTGGVEALAAAVRERLGLPKDATIANLVAEGCCDGAFDNEALRRACAALAGGSAADKERAATLQAWLDEPATRVDGLTAYRSAFITTSGTIRRTLATRAALKLCADADRILSAEAERLLQLGGLCNAAIVADATVALATLALAQLEIYEERKRRRGMLDFDDLVLRSRALLESGAAAWVQFKLDGGVDHVLIDEGQDTNPDQWAVVDALVAEFFSGLGARDLERTVFAVGDPKQSIYSFQRADPSRFATMQAAFRARSEAALKAWEDIGLDVSFRSVPVVLQAVDAVFAQETASAGVLPAGAVLRHHAHRAGEAGLVEVWPPVGEEPADVSSSPWDAPTTYQSSPDPQARLAEAIAATIAGWLERGELLEARGRPIRAGDVMILVRRRTAFIEALVRELKRRDVPVAGVDRMRLAEQLAVADLMAVARFLLLPEDDLTLAVVLKSPLGGLDEDQLFALAAGRTGSLWHNLGRLAAEQPTSAFAEAHSLLTTMLAQADLLRPYELFADLLGPRRGRRKLLARLGAEANDPIDVFLSQALAYERLHPPSLQGFVQWMETGQDEVKRDMEQGGRDEVRIITVHGAKGLQAPIVILPDTVQPPQPRRPPFWVPGEPDDLVLWSPKKALDDPVTMSARDAAAASDAEEYRRLLYVALTRAEDRLYVCGWCKNAESIKPTSWYGLVSSGLAGLAETVWFDFGDRIERGWKGEGLRLTGGQAVAATSAIIEPAASQVEPLPDWAGRPAPQEATSRPLAPSQPEEADAPPPQSPLGGDNGLRFRRGILIHRLLQTLPELDPAARPPAAARFVERGGRDIPAEAREEIVREVLAVLDDPAFAPVFEPGSQAEVAVAGPVGGLAFSGQIDRLAVSEGRVLVVDYKSNRPPPPNAERVSSVYLRQMATYRALLRRIYPGLPVHCALLWTETPRLMPLPDGLLDRYAPAEGTGPTADRPA